jgi:hypothetical protein
MDVKKAIKKVIALGTGATMVGATIMGAMAANLNDYPAPFISKDANGRPVFDAWLVVGDNAAPQDILGITDIAMSLQFQMTEDVAVPGRGGSSRGSILGDGISISESNDMLEIRERLGAVRQTLTEFDLDGLRGGTISTNEGTTDYNQYLRFEDANLTSGSTDYVASGWVEFDQDEDDVVGDYLFFKSGDVIFEYEVEFEEGLESEITCITGTTCTEGVKRQLDDLEDEQITILGTDYSVVSTRILTSSNKLTIELLGGDVTDTLEEGQTKTYNIDGKPYEVFVLIISDASGSSNADTVKFVVNGEVTDELEDGETDILSDGTEIGVRSILPNEAGEISGGDLVEFFLGANKVEWTDSDYTDDNFDEGGVEVNTENIEEAKVKIKGSVTGTDVFQLSSIKYRLKADAVKGDVYVRPGEGIKQFLDEPEGMLNPDWDIVYGGLADTGVSVLKLDAAGDDSYNLQFENREGLQYSVPFVDNSRDDENSFKYGDEDNDLVWVEGNVSTANIPDNIYNIDRNDYFVVTDDPQDETSFTHVLRYESIDTVNRQISFSDEGTGQREVTYQTTALTGSLGTASLVVGGNTFKVYVGNMSHGNHYSGLITDTSQVPLAIDQNGDGRVEADEIKVVINGGGILELGNKTQDWHNGTVAETADGRLQCATADADAKGTHCQISSGAGIAEITLNLLTLSSEFDGNGVLDTGSGENINITVKAVAGNEVDTAIPSNQTIVDSTTNYAKAQKGGSRVVTLLKMIGLDNEDVKQGLSTYGVFFDLTDDTDNADELTIEYPLSQRGADVFLVMGEGSEVSTTGAGSGGAVSTRVHQINVGATKLAGQVSDVTAQNLIVVGGPCINQAAAELMSNPEPCGQDFEAGKAWVRMFENGDNVALLVAGYEATDTTRASKVVAENGGSKLKALDDGVDAVSVNTVSPTPTIEVAVPE